MQALGLIERINADGHVGSKAHGARYALEQENAGDAELDWRNLILNFWGLHLTSRPPRPPRPPLFRVEIDFVAGIQGFDLSSYVFNTEYGDSPRNNCASSYIFCSTCAALMSCRQRVWPSGHSRAKHGAQSSGG